MPSGVPIELALVAFEKIFLERYTPLISGSSKASNTLMVNICGLSLTPKV